MKNLLKLEELAQLLLSIYLFSSLPFAWWVYPVFFLAPDVSMLMLMLNKRLGTPVYNLFHHKALAVGVYLLGSLFGFPPLALAGVVLLGHSSLDRVLGFGLLASEPKGSVTTGSLPQGA